MRNLYSTIAIFFMAITVVAILFIIHLTMASATIQIPAKIDTFNFDDTVTLDQMPSPPLSVTLERQQSYPVSGKIITTDTAATVVTIQNLSSISQTLIKTTRFLSAEKKLFRLADTVTVPSHSSAGAVIIADKAGSDFLVPAGRFTIPGLPQSQQDKIFGESTQAASFDRPESASLTAHDIEQARQQLIDALKEQAASQLMEDHAELMKITPDQIVATIMDETVTPAEGTKTQQFSLKIAATFSTIPLDKQRILSVTEAAVKQKLPSTTQLREIKTDTLQYSLISFSTSTSSSTLKVHVEAEVNTAGGIKDFINPALLAGKTPDQAKAYLLQQGVNQATITLSPFWVRRIPRITDHIHIETAPQ